MFSADSYCAWLRAGPAGDGDLSTIWHTEFVGATPGYPHELVVDLGLACARLRGYSTSPARTRPTAGSKTSRSASPTTVRPGTQPLASGRWENDPSFKYVALPGSLRLATSSSAA